MRCAYVAFLFLFQGAQAQTQQVQQLQQIGQSLQNFGVELTVKLSNTLHDREIRYTVSELAAYLNEFIAVFGRSAQIMGM